MNAHNCERLISITARTYGGSVALTVVVTGGGAEVMLNPGEDATLTVLKLEKLAKLLVNGVRSRRGRFPQNTSATCKTQTTAPAS